MAMSSQPPSDTRPEVSNTERRALPDGVAEILASSLRVGAGAGACGLLFGATAGIVRGTTPILFSLVSGFQWFGLGSVYYGTRKLAIARHGPEEQATPFHKVEGSALAGAVTGATMGGLLRGPRNIIPGTIVLSLLGGGGQFAVNKWSAAEGSSEKKSSWLDSKWSPMKKLTDEQYENILEEKLLRLEADIAIIDENLAELRTQKEARAAAVENAAQQTSMKGDIS